MSYGTQMAAIAQRMGSVFSNIRDKIDATFFKTVTARYTAQAMPVTNTWVDVLSLDNGRLIAISSDGTDRIYVSDDFGESWLAITTTVREWKSIAAHDNVVILVAHDTILKSTNYGDTWNAVLTPAGQWNHVSYHPRENTWIVLSEGGPTRAVRSIDDFATNGAGSGITSLMNSVVDTGSGYIAYSESGISRIYTSSDGLVWSQGGNVFGFNPKHVSFMSDINKYIGVGHDATNPEIYVSNDGLTWDTHKLTDLTSIYRKVLPLPELGVVCAIGGNGGDSNLIFSTDGINWHNRPIYINQDWVGVAWIEKMERIALLSSDGTNQLTMT